MPLLRPLITDLERDALNIILIVTATMAGAWNPRPPKSKKQPLLLQCLHAKDGALAVHLHASMETVNPVGSALSIWKQMPRNLWYPVLVRVAVAVMNPIAKRYVEMTGFSLSYASACSSLSFIIEGSQGRNSSRTRTWRKELMQRHGRVLLSGLLIMACSAWFLIDPRATSPGIAPPTID